MLSVIRWNIQLIGCDDVDANNAPILCCQAIGEICCGLGLAGAPAIAGVVYQV